MPSLPQVLAAIEAKEIPLLSWGISDPVLSEPELLGWLAEWSPDADPEDLLDRLIESGLVVESDRGFRSRMAETVRLATRLRQWFPQQHWSAARTLVSDFRFVRQERTVPKRHRSDEELLETLRRGGYTGVDDVALRALVDGRELSDFQLRSTATVLELLETPRDSGVCVTAGTGAGKTLAFYLPALAHLASKPSPSRSSRLVGIYPRTELLRDQLRALLVELRRLPTTYSTQISVGVLYGSTPHNAEDAATSKYRRWVQRDGGLVCPFLSCLSAGCTGDYVLVDAKQEHLRCSRCGDLVKNLRLFRDSQLSSPPTILFTTTEMVNRSLGNNRWRRLLIGDQHGGPDLLLLDEIHTYSGSHGAQVAGLLRRWRADMKTPCRFVGLSATLADAVGFFSTLTGVADTAVSVVSPRDNELVSSGHQYTLVLRGDPASQTALLSTTIQASMLQRRMLDPELGAPSDGTYGSKVFVFTDQLDVVNRLYDQLCDAEGWLPGGTNPNRQGPLARLRAQSAGDLDRRDAAGQLWEWADRYNSLDSARVGRTSSQDVGVDHSSQIVVATGSLEVGFDDPAVGAVIQHKAPRDSASFLQRRGRAGRNPSMRPWTTVVLSDYGRDRLAFQGYEELVEPVIRPLPLPIDNRVILKMQATWLLLDDLRLTTDGVELRRILERSWSSNRNRQRELATRAATRLATYLESGGTERLRNRVAFALGITQHDAEAVLWDFPRGLLTSVVPSVIRRLEAISSNELPEHDWPDVLAEFVPSTLFNALHTPEVRLSLPPAFDADEPDRDVLPVTMALTQFPPGRVNYRFALRGQRHRMWIPPPPEGSDMELDESVPSFRELHPPRNFAGRLVQPLALNLAKPEKSTPDSANGTWVWRFSAQTDGQPLRLDVPESAWSDSVLAFEAHLHRLRAPVTIWRFANECRIEVDSDTRFEANLRLGGEPVSIGMSYEVDAFRLRVALPSSIEEYELDDETLRGLRPGFFHHLVDSEDVVNSAAASPFLRRWLAELAHSSLLLTPERSFASAIASLSDAEWAAAMVNTARNVFGAEDVSEDSHAGTEPRLVQQIRAVLSNPGVMAAVRHCAVLALVEPLDDSHLAWLHQRAGSTLAAAVLDAAQAVCPTADLNAVTPDYLIDGSDLELWLSEDDPGGTGALSSVVDAYLEDPRRFWGLVTSALDSSERENVDSSMLDILSRVSNGHLELLADLASIRAASDLSDLQQAWGHLRESLFHLGVDPSPALLSLLSTRLLRPDSSPKSDDFVHDLLVRWHDLEVQFGSEVGLRTFATFASRQPEVSSALDQVAAGASGRTERELISQLSGLLWNRGAELRSAALQCYNRYCPLPPTERLLLARFSRRARPSVHMTSADWRLRVDSALSDAGECDVVCLDANEAAEAVASITTVPSTADVIEVYPRVAAVSRSQGAITLTLEIREALQ